MCIVLLTPTVLSFAIVDVLFLTMSLCFLASSLPRHLQSTRTVRLLLHSGHVCESSTPQSCGNTWKKSCDSRQSGHSSQD